MSTTSVSLLGRNIVVWNHPKYDRTKLPGVLSTLGVKLVQSGATVGTVRVGAGVHSPPTAQQKYEY